MNNFKSEIPNPSVPRNIAEESNNDTQLFHFRDCLANIQAESRAGSFKTTCYLSEFYANLYREKGYTVKHENFSNYKISW